MIHKVSAQQYSILKSMYDRAIENLPNKVKLDKNEKSLFCYFVTRATNNDRYSILKNASVRYIPRSDVINMTDLNLIRLTDDDESYTLTSKGLFFIESQLGKISEEFMIYFFDDKFFDIYDKKPINSKRKVILLSMVAMRTFSEKSAISMRMDSKIKDSWYEVLKEISEYLVDCGVLDPKNSLKSVDDSTEHPASKIMRHTEGLSAETRSIYNNLAGNNTYYLDVCSDGYPDASKISIIISLIFEDKLTENNYKTIMDYIVEYARSPVSMNFIGTTDETFDGIQYDDCIESAFKIAVSNVANKA